MVKIQMLKVLFGDSLIVIVNENEKEEIILLIDCGFNYKTEILPKLEMLKAKNKRISRFIVTHFDSDHIAGARDFIKSNGDAASPKVIKVEQVWLNIFRHLQFKKRESEELNDQENKELKRYIKVKSVEANNQKEGKISAGQASLLGSELLKNKYSWNTDFEENAVSIEYRQKITLNEDCELILLTPNKEALEALEIKFTEFLNRRKIRILDNEVLDDAFELFVRSHENDNRSVNQKLISSKIKKVTAESIENVVENVTYNKDDSPANRSSISFILKTKDKKFCFWQIVLQRTQC